MVDIGKLLGGLDGVTGDRFAEEGGGSAAEKLMAEMLPTQQNAAGTIAQGAAQVPQMIPPDEYGAMSAALLEDPNQNARGFFETLMLGDDPETSYGSEIQRGLAMGLGGLDFGADNVRAGTPPSIGAGATNPFGSPSRRSSLRLGM